MANETPVVKVTSLNQEFTLKNGSKVPILKDVNFSIPTGSFTIIYGQSGSGKSTLLHLLAGLDVPAQGSVEVTGRDICAMDSADRTHFRASMMGLVYQTNYWVKSLSVIENVALPLMLLGEPKAAALKEARISLERVKMERFADSSPSVMSGGEQQRVSMARALVANPQLILADEPTGNLDSTNGQMIIELLQKINRELGCTIVLVTHNLEYLPLSDQRLFVRDGRVTSEDGVYYAPQPVITPEPMKVIGRVSS